MKNVAAARTAPASAAARFDVPPRGSSTTATATAAATAPGGGSDGSGGIRRPKASFLERCGRALTKKRSFWKKKKDEEK